MAKSTKISIEEAVSKLTFLPDRTPETSAQDAANAFAVLSEYRDGGIFVGHYAGSSEWERHGSGDEFVMVLDGETTMTLLEEGVQRQVLLSKGELIVVPRNTWHRFDTPTGVQILTITPQPTDHQRETPE